MKRIFENKSNFRPLFSPPPRKMVVICDTINNKKTAWCYTRDLCDDIRTQIKMYIHTTKNISKEIIEHYKLEKELKSYGIKT